MVRAKVTADLARARKWAPHITSLPPVLADRKLCEYTRVLQLTALEQRVYATIEAERAPPEPVGLFKKGLAWLLMAVLTLFPMCVPMPPAAARRCRPPLPPAAAARRPHAAAHHCHPHACLGIARSARAFASVF